jgi:hypothetical protein
VASNRRNQPAVVARDNPFIRDLTFEGPNVEDSHFNYCELFTQIITYLNSILIGILVSLCSYMKKNMIMFKMLDMINVRVRSNVSER